MTEHKLSKANNVSLNALSIFGIAVLSACASSVPLPSNVTTTADGQAGYISAVDFSYRSAQLRTFSQLKLCVAENISNNAVILGDAAGSFVGPATGNYYQANHSQTIQGGDIFKYVDDGTSTLIATGTVDGGAVAFGLTRDIVKFDLKAADNGNAVTLKFSNVLRAQQSTGSSTNEGFGPVGVWTGSRPDQIYSALEGVAEKVKACLS
jgi:hypothetical protein